MLRRLQGELLHDHDRECLTFKGAGFPPETNLWGDTNLLKKGICLLNTFLKDFTKMPIKKTLFCSLMGGISPPCQNHGGDKSHDFARLLSRESLMSLVVLS